MPLITSPVIVRHLVIAFGAGALGVALLVTALGAYGALPLIGAIFVVMAALALVVAAAIEGVTQGGPTGEFALDPDGVRYRAGREWATIHRTVMGGSALAGSLSGTGGGLIAIGRERGFMRWDEVRSVTADRRDRSLLFHRDTLIFPIVVYCTEENFDAAIAMVGRHLPEGRIRIKEG
jgi:hypothetical protein